MTSRRKFLIQGSVAATALVAAKPLKTIAGAGFAITGFSTNQQNTITFLHTGIINQSNRYQLGRYITERKNAGNVVVLHAGNNEPDLQAKMNYDASIVQDNALSTAENNYRIFHKGNFKIGVIRAIEGETGILRNINNLASYLKKEKNCHLVVCLSQLGHENKNALDDLALAVKSVHLDMIIGGNEKNHCKYPVIALNKNKEEVIIHAAGTALSMGIIEITFDDSGKKRNIAFINKFKSINNKNLLKSTA